MAPCNGTTVTPTLARLLAGVDQKVFNKYRRPNLTVSLHIKRTYSRVVCYLHSNGIGTAYTSGWEQAAYVFYLKLPDHRIRHMWTLEK